MDLDPLSAVMVCLPHRMLGLSHGLETESSPSPRWTLSPWAAMTSVKVALSIRACSSVVSRFVKSDLCDARPVQQAARAQTLLVDAPTSEDTPDVPGQRLSSQVDARRWMMSRLSPLRRDCRLRTLPTDDRLGRLARLDRALRRNTFRGTSGSRAIAGLCHCPVCPSGLQSLPLAHRRAVFDCCPK
jgi:hypothetical protein